MQVNEVHDHVNHAIIGGQPSIEMGISTSAEFFNILSSTLYRDQMLAMVREVLCNANDAHIESGCQDTPIIVTVTNDHFIVTDSGSGIHKDDMGPIYGVYGNSTKKNDGTQTGGFGLGCKSPFAYTDHFEVTSCHEGIKTIYRISKSTVQTAGKPAIVPIASFPTTQRGLSVKIDLITTSDKHRITELVKRIGHNGEMLINLNGQMQPRLGFDDKVHSFHIYRNKQLLEEQNRISVRYGNVIYPLEICKELADQEHDILAFLNKITKNAYDNASLYRIVFQAPAHSLSVTPSRESLSMQEHTIKTLKQLFDSFLNQVQTTFEAECNNFTQEAIEDAVAKKSYKDLLSRTPRLPYDREKMAAEFQNPLVLTDFKTIARQYMLMTYPKDLSFRNADWKTRVLLMSTNGMIDRGMAQTWLQEIDTVATFADEYRYGSDEANSWLARRVIAPLLGKLTLDPKMDPKKLYALDDSDRSARNYSRSGGLIPANKVHPAHLYNTAAYMRKIVVLARKKSEIHQRCTEHEVFKKLGNKTGYLFYHVGLKAEDAANARTFWAKTGMNVVDMIDRQEWEQDTIAPSQKTSVARVITPRKKGLVTVGSMLNKDGVIDINLLESPGTVRNDKPEFIVRTYTRSGGNYNQRFRQFNIETSQIIAKLYGNRGVISSNATQYVNYTEKRGVPTMSDFIAKEVLAYFKTNLAEIKNHWANSYQRTTEGLRIYSSLDYRHKGILRAIHEIPELVAHYQVGKPAVSETTMNYILLYDQLILHPELAALKIEMDQISLAKNHGALIEKIFKNASMLRLLNGDQMLSVYETAKADPKRTAMFVQLVTTILEN